MADKKAETKNPPPKPGPGKLNLFEKLVEVRKSTPYIKKDSQNTFHKFNYASSSAVLATLRTAMDELGVLLVPEIPSFEIKDHQTRQGKHEYFTVLTMQFTWINAENPDDKITIPWMGQGLDDSEKGLGKALTYSEKFFLLKFFNIATDDYDADAFHRKTENNKGTKAKPQPAANPPANQQPAADKKKPGRPAQTPEQKYQTLIGRCDTPDKWEKGLHWLAKQPWATEAIKSNFETDFVKWQNLTAENGGAS